MILNGDPDRFMAKADMHVHLGSVERTYTLEDVPGPEKVGGLYQVVCRLIADLMVHPMASEYFGVDFHRIEELFIKFNHDPASLLELATKLGMTYLAVTDHDTIEPVMRFLNQNPDLADKIIVGEEVTTHYKDGIDLHVGVYGLDRAQHNLIQEARADLRRELVPCLEELGLTFALNHPFQVPVSRNGARLSRGDMEELGALFSVVEKRNGLLPQRLNERAEEFFQNKGSIAGSDSHRRSGIGRTYTVAPGSTKEQFLQAIKDGEGEVRGAHGTVLEFILEILDKISSYGSVARFRIPEKLVCTTRLSIQNVMHDAGYSTLSHDGRSIATVPITGKWKIIEALISLFSALSAPMYAPALLRKDPHIDEELLS